MRDSERRNWVVRELTAMARTRYADPGTMQDRKRRLLREIHAIWPGQRRKPNERAIAAIVGAVRNSRRRGMTGDELERSLRMLHQTIGAPLLIARHRGLIVNSGKRRKTRNNREAIVWRAA